MRIFSKCILSHHLHGADVLSLLHINVRQVQPDVADIGRGLPDLGEHVSGLTEITLVGQDGSYKSEGSTNISAKGRTAKYLNN